jgi:hypothetical protein
MVGNPYTATLMAAKPHPLSTLKSSAATTFDARLRNEGLVGFLWLRAPCETADGAR